MRRTLALVAIFAALAGLGATNSPKGSTENIVELPDCMVMLIEEAQVPSREPGPLVEIKVKEGDEVKAGDLIARIDDSEAQVQRKDKEIEFLTAQAKAEDDISVRFSRKAADVKQAEYEKALEANKKVRGAVSDIDVQRSKLDWQKSVLEIEKSQLEQKIAGMTADAKKAEVDFAELGIVRRKLLAPLDGVVVRVNHHVGEWAPAGEPIAHIVRVNRLRVEGNLVLTKHDPRRVMGQKVEVEVELSDGRKSTYPGQVVFVSPLVEAGGDYRVWAEVDNHKSGGVWELLPGMTSKMTIHLK